jgi:hypothetical protein
MKLRDEGNGTYSFECPGCKGRHVVNTVPKNGLHWDFNGSLDSPTFSPSVKAMWGKYADKNWKAPKNWDPSKTGFYDPSGQCHFFVKEGKIQFCGDSTHELKNQTVDMEEIK